MALRLVFISIETSKTIESLDITTNRIMSAPKGTVNPKLTWGVPKIISWPNHNQAILKPKQLPSFWAQQL
jgi:hypothetical protein